MGAESWAAEVELRATQRQNVGPPEVEWLATGAEYRDTGAECRAAGTES